MEEATKGNNATERTQEGGSYPPEEKGEIRTLFVSGLPQDVRYREVYNFFRFFPKFEHCVLNLKQRSPVAWISFQTPEDAIAAQRKTNFLKFDPDDFEHNLNVELAKHNSVLKKRTHADIQQEQETQKRYRMEHGQQMVGPMTSIATPQVFGQYPPAAQYPPPSQYPRKVGRYPPQGALQGSTFAVEQPGASGNGTWASYQPGASTGSGVSVGTGSGTSGVGDRTNSNASGAYGVAPLPRTQQFMNPVAYAQAYSAFHSHVSTPVTTGGNAPCNTLFVANIHRDTTEEEIREAFQGCTRLRFNPPRESGGPICFVEYDSVQTATTVREVMNGFRFKNDYGKGIKIEYAKNPMGTRSSKNLPKLTDTPANTYGPSPYPK